MRRALVCASLSLLTLTACRHASPLIREIPERFDQPDAAEEYFRMNRGLGDSDNLQVRYNAARAALAAASPRAGKGPPTEIAPGPWTFLGPGNIGGRTRALLVDPNNPKVLYAGGISGGIWKST